MTIKGSSIFSSLAPPIDLDSCRPLKRTREEGEKEGRVAKKQKTEQTEKKCRLTSSTITKKYLEAIQRGEKRVEGRINSGMFARIKVGEQIQFFNGKKKVRCNVTTINRYDSFESLLKEEGVAPCLPDIKSLEDGIRIYNSIPGYAQKAAQYGVLAFHLEVVPIPNCSTS